MSDKESRFLNILTSVLGSFILALVIGMFVFYRMTIVGMAEHTVEIKNNEEDIKQVRAEIREDLKAINSKLDVLYINIKN